MDGRLRDRARLSGERITGSCVEMVVVKKYVQCNPAKLERIKIINILECKPKQHVHHYRNYNAG